MKKKLKPSSSHFLSQKFWKILRGFVDRNIWTFLYVISQKLKINSLLNILRDENLDLKKNLKYFKSKSN